MKKNRQQKENNFLRRGIWGFILHGIFLSAANAFTQITTVQTSFIYQFTGSNFLSGLLFTAYRIGTILPQPFAGRFVQRYPVKKIFVQIAIATRGGSWLIIALLTFWAGTRSPQATVAVFFAILMVFFVMGGVGNVSYYHLFSNIIPDGLRGRVMGWRYFLGGLVGVGAGYSVKVILHSSLSFPQNYAVLFLLAAVSFLFAFIGFSIIRDPGDRPVERQIQWRAYWHLILDSIYFRRLILVEFFLSASFIALPFYVIFARDSLLLSEGYLGLFVTLQVVGEIVSGPLWGWMGDRFRFKPVLVSIAVVSFLIPLLAIALPRINPALFSLVFFLVGTTLRGLNIASANYLLEFAPKEEVAVYVGIKNFVMLPTVFYPLAGGLLVPVLGYQKLFVLEAFLLLIGIMFSFALKNTRPFAAGERRVS